jgi:hypothetical protein
MMAVATSEYSDKASGVFATILCSFAGDKLGINFWSPDPLNVCQYRPVSFLRLRAYVIISNVRQEACRIVEECFYVTLLESIISDQLLPIAITLLVQSHYQVKNTLRLS